MSKYYFSSNKKRLCHKITSHFPSRAISLRSLDTSDLSSACTLIMYLNGHLWDLNSWSNTPNGITPCQHVADPGIGLPPSSDLPSVSLLPSSLGPSGLHGPWQSPNPSPPVREGHTATAPPLMGQHYPNPLGRGSMRMERPHGFTPVLFICPIWVNTLPRSTSATEKRGTPWSPWTFPEPSSSGGFTLGGEAVCLPGRPLVC